MNNSLEDVGTRLTEIASKRTADIFTMSARKLDRLRDLNSRVGGSSGDSVADEARRRVQLDVARSKNPHFQAAHSSWDMHGMPDYRRASTYDAFDRMVNPMSFLLLTQFGEDLRERMINDPLIATALLRLISNRADAEVAGNNADVMIARPIHAYVHMRKGLLERIEKTMGYGNLIQKQERLLVRIGTTIDYVLAKHAQNESLLVQGFVTSWSNHVNVMSQSSHSRYVAPVALAVQMMELMLALCDPYRLTALIPDPGPVKDCVLEAYPMKLLNNEILNASRLNSSNSFFN